MREHWLQYHLPAVMGTSVNEFGDSPFAMLSAKVIEQSVGAVVWIVGRTEDDHLASVYLAG